jgi:hypothetical protein
VAHTDNLSIQEAEAGEFQVLSQPGLHSKILKEKKKRKKRTGILLSLRKKWGRQLQNYDNRRAFPLNENDMLHTKTKTNKQKNPRDSFWILEADLDSICVTSDKFLARNWPRIEQ